MKKIINGKMYNTETAKCLASWFNGSISFDMCQEWLYRKKTGEYFLYGEGGASSKYSEYCGFDQWSGGSAFTPLTEEEAREWAEQKLDADDYVSIFGEVEE